MFMNETMIHTILAAFGYTTRQVRENFEEKTKIAFGLVAGFDQRLQIIEHNQRVLSAQMAQIAQHFSIGGTPATRGDIMLPPNGKEN